MDLCGMDFLMLLWEGMGTLLCFIVVGKWFVSGYWHDVLHSRRAEEYCSSGNYM